MRAVKRVLGTRVMLRLLENKREVGDGIIIQDDGESLPLAQVIDFSSEVGHLVDKGDIVHYIKGRDSGKCLHNGEEHYIIPISNVVAILNK